MESSKYFKQILKGSTYGLIGKLIGSILEFSFVIYMTRNLSLVFVGYYFIGLAVFRFIHAYSVSGFDYTARRFMNMDINKKFVLNIFKNKWKIRLFQVYSGMLVFVILSYYLSDEFPKIMVVTGFIFTVPFASIVTIGTSILQGVKKIFLASLLKDVLIPFFRIVIVFLLINLNFDIYGVMLGYFLSYLIIGSITIGIIRSVIYSSKRGKDSLVFNNHEDEVKKYSSHMMYITIINLIVIWGTTIILSYFTTPENVSLYSVACRISQFTGLLIMAVNVIFEPIISELYSRRKSNDLIQTYRNTTNILLIVMLIVTIIIVSFSNYILSLFGSEYGSAQSLLICIMLGQFIGVLPGPAGNILVMIGYQKLSFNLNLVIAFIIILLDLIFIPIFGVLGAAVLAGLGLASKNVISLLFLFLKEKITPFSSTYWFLLSTGLFGLITLLIFNNSVTGFIVAIILCICFIMVGLNLLFKNTQFLNNGSIKA